MSNVVWHAVKKQQDGSAAHYVLLGDWSLMVKGVHANGADNGWSLAEKFHDEASVGAKSIDLTDRGFTVTVCQPGTTLMSLENMLAMPLSAPIKDEQKALPANSDSGKVTSAPTQSQSTSEDTIMYTAASIKDLPTPDLIGVYNKLTGKSIKRFATREKGEAQVLKAQEGGKSAGKVAQQVNGKAKAVAATAVAAKPRKVNGSAGSATGRPAKDFNVKLNQNGESTSQADSLRAQLMTWLDKKEDKTSTMSAINKHFDRKMNGVVQKLVGFKWLRVTAIKE